MEQLIEFTNNHLLLVTGTMLMGLAVIFNELRIRASAVSAEASPAASFASSSRFFSSKLSKVATL